MIRKRIFTALAAGVLAFLPLVALAQVPSAQPTFEVKQSKQALKLTAQTVSTNGLDQVNPTGRGLKCVVNLTAVSGTTPTLTVTIQGKDSLTTTSPPYFTELTSASLTAAGVTVLTIYPGVTVTANVAASDVVPSVYRVITTEGGTTPSFTGTVNCYSIP